MELRGILLLAMVGVVTVPSLAQDLLSISSFSVEQTSTSVEISLTLSGDAVGMNGCFFNMLTILDGPVGSPGFRPRYPGVCDFSSQSRNILVGSMDIRDYVDLFQFQTLLTSVQDSYIATRTGSPVSLIPGVSVTPITAPLQAGNYIPFTGSFAIASFDIDLSTNMMLLHFNGLVAITTLNITQITLSESGRPVTNSISLSDDSAAMQGQLATTICILLSAADLTQLTERGICQNASTCYGSFSAGFIQGYTAIPAPALNSLQVSALRSSSSSNLPVFMRLSLSYIGCTAAVQHNLVEDEVYVLRPYEYVSRLDCFANNVMNSSNVQPQISRGNSFSGSDDATIEEYIVYNWPVNVFLREIPSELYGQYVCRSSIGYYVRNYVHNNNSNIELPDGSTFRLPVYDPLTISFYFGSYPRVDLLQMITEVILFNIAAEAGVAVEPVYERVNSFHVNIKYAMTQQLISGNYEIRINRGSFTLARQPITIDVTDPTITLLPEVATVVSGQEDIVLTCTTNSPSLQVRWLSDAGTILSYNDTYRVELPTDILRFNCSVVDPATDTVLASAVVPVVNVQEILSVWRSGSQLENNSLIVIPTGLSGSLVLQCLEHEQTTLTDLSWVILPDNGSLITPSLGKEGDIYRVDASGNQATLSIDNSQEPFRGLLKCLASSGEVVNIRVAGQQDEPVVCMEESDPIWGIQWTETIAGNRDFQPCAGAMTNGFALRLCNEDGDWNDTIYINECSNENFIDLQNMAEDMVFRLRNAYNQDQLETVVSQLIRAMNATTQPQPMTLFPRDLDVANGVLESLIDLLSEELLPSIHTELVDVLDSLHHVNNTEGWQLLTEMNEGSQRLLNISENFGLYLLRSLRSEQPLQVERNNIAYSAMLINEYNQDIVYPADLSRGAQITLPASLLSQVQPIGAVHSVMKNLDDFLPKPDSSSGLCVSSSVFSSQLQNAAGLVTRFGDSQSVAIQFITDGVPRATNPVCLFWDALQGQWSSVGINSTLLDTSDGEIKRFGVSCSSNHLTVFGVAVTRGETEFNFSIPVYVGCGFVIFSSVLSIFSLFLSCICDTLRDHSMVAFLIHLSFMASLLCAYIAFLAGIEGGLNQRIGCVAVAALLHYFFTAAFTWLFLEGLLLVFFKPFSKYCGLIIAVFLIGWGLPAIPTAISLGVLHESYGATQHCWFFFDGEVSDGVVLGFIIPKLILIGATLVTLLIGCCTNCKFSNKKMQPYLKTNVARILWLIWGSICLFLIFLAASWVFALLMVNVYGIDSEILGWVFMAASILLGIWMFIFSFTVMVINQKVDYDRLWNSPDPVYPSSDPGRGKGYQFMNMSALDLSGRRTSTLTRPPTVLSNPVFGVDNQ